MEFVAREAITVNVILVSNFTLTRSIFATIKYL